ncbi:acetylglutamate kinase [Melioribacter roseus P3M-2]|uniref:Acetylglutamate kinase n=1 Tax=Melioribacter roseus (strain DSM 23840 / JCM 17771 / VKM B-2668 / P3M-2) TaxID=1191523 RepID=I7A0E1_MELRP|nr:[LysW]-aminoadipate kinase [Melioribacter roseus]AFN73406.1 acetylglutamate kinase [Melioribacter roseus P3M-2]
MLLIKIGGGADINIKGIIEDLAKLDEKFIILHGANALRDQIGEKIGYKKRVVTSVSGYDSVFSAEETIDLMMMTYAGLRNKRIVELCHQNGINAVGLSGLDGKVVEAKRNSGIRVRENGKTLLLRDFSGKPKSINKHLLDLLLDNGYTPVLSVPLIDENNFAVNSENDDILALLQKEFNADKIISLIEAPGFLLDKNDPDSLVNNISRNELEAMEQKVEGRMKRKILALRKLFEGSPTTVIISDGRTAHPVDDALNGKGTTIS